VCVLTGVTKSVTMCAGMEEAYQCLGVVTVGHDDVPVTRVRQMLGSMQTQARGRSGDDGGLLARGCS